MPSYPFALPPPVALAAAVDGFTVPGVSDMVWEAKWDGFRAIVTPEGLWSRAGKPLGRYFPEVARNAAQRLPPGAVLDAEIISWNAATQRTDFTALTRRFTAGNRVAGLAARQPAQLVAFDLLAANGADLRRRPLRERRAQLAALLAEAGGPAIALCQQTDRLDQARTWFHDYTAAGLEGLVMKRTGQPYPTSPKGLRIWWKYKARNGIDLIVTAVTGDLTQPDTIVLALPAADGSLRTVGTTTRLTRSAATDLGRTLTATGTTRERWLTALPGTADAPTTTRGVTPVVVEVLADVAVDNGVFRHPARYLRPRPDLGPADLNAAD